MIRVQGNTYEVVEDVRGGWSEEAFKERFSEVLNRYDYIVGDWGYEQLRLKGLFEDDHKKAALDSRISFLPEYLYEYCNFGCAYFVVRKVKQPVEKPPEEAEEKQETPAGS
ncbi:DUF1027 domain-containing protein [Alkalicoccus urumqiensis]|uniref:DUF1027 domain-containing protein n=2 Tax=Alkalicoccus urumqiensis TaxID=1548213 RepID=A0A2P6MGX8_ALKUR|nr:YutD family protein [Alkalicoccus urumqiensis]PRO65533.1 DUF1027 domain-containing protein [Alkalicoccus urumqiensis]